VQRLNKMDTVAVYCLLPGQGKDLSAPTCITDYIDSYLYMISYKLTYDLML
jgi:hypothetical protein